MAVPVPPPALPLRSHRWPRRLIAGVGLALTVAPQPLLAAPPAAAEQAIRASYRCLGRFDAMDVTALFFNRPPAELVLLMGETATRLPQLRAASGSRYGSADQQFWIKGDRAIWTLGRSPAMACEVQPPDGSTALPGASPGSPAGRPR